MPVPGAFRLCDLSTLKNLSKTYGISSSGIILPVLDMLIWTTPFPSLCVQIFSSPLLSQNFTALSIRFVKTCMILSLSAYTICFPSGMFIVTSKDLSSIFVIKLIKHCLITSLISHLVKFIGNWPDSNFARSKRSPMRAFMRFVSDKTISKYWFLSCSSIVPSKIP